jgi:hypothetical protein
VLGCNISKTPPGGGFGGPGGGLPGLGGPGGGFLCSSSSSST